jgi:DNA polymerase
MNTFAIDFETYYDRDYSLKKMDAYSYVHHPKFDCYLMSVFGSDFKWIGHPKDFNQWHLFENAILVAHNAAFDSLVFRRLQEKGIIPSPLSSDLCPLTSGQTWRCTASLAVYLSAPRSLKGACKQLLNIDVDKTQRSKASGQSGADLFGNEAMFAYALEDARLCFLLWEKFNHLWPDDEQELATLTFEWAQEGIAVDLQTLEKSIQTLETQRFNAVQNLPWVDDPDSDTPLSHSKLAITCREAGIPCPVSLAMDDPDCEAWEEKYGPEYPWVDSMRTFRRTNMLLSRFYAVRSRVRKSDGCFPYALKYFGAVPGRWSGDAGFNVQNMPRGELFGADLRKCFVPKSGNVFIIADLCQIEPRILAWLIEDEAFLSLVRSGVDIYEAHARSTMGYSDSRPLKESDPDKRALAKARVLGLGYGCGPQKFVTVAKNLGSIDISFADAKKTVADFRSKNPRISRLWNQLDRDFKRSAGGDYSIELPSGRVLRYFNVAKTPRGYYAAATERGGKLRSLYGCLLTENLVQATARDLFAEHLLQIHRAGIGRIVFHVHDEVIVEVPAFCADEAREQIQAIMSITPDWLSGCPVAAESKILNRYTK